MLTSSGPDYIPKMFVFASFSKSSTDDEGPGQDQWKLFKGWEPNHIDHYEETPADWVSLAGTLLSISCCHCQVSMTEGVTGKFVAGPLTLCHYPVIR